jgi:PAS domain S-box-containing protein
MKQIMVVEDDRIVAEHIRRSLQDMGYSVPAIASSAGTAIKEAKEKRPDLILMDIVLEGEMDGIETALQIHSRFNIPVVYLTAYSDDKMMERAKITEPFGYVIKPFNVRELHVIIEIALYKHKMEMELKEREQWLAATVKNLGEAVIATDKKGIIKTINPFAEALTGWKKEDALGKPLATVFNIISEGTDKKVEDPVTKAIKEDSFYGLAEHTVLIAKEGARIPVDIIGTAIKNDRDGIIGVVLVFYDIIDLYSGQNPRIGLVQTFVSPDSNLYQETFFHI